MTGRSAHANGLVGLAHDSWLYYDDVRTMPELMRELGYTTTLMGLQHEQPDPLVLGYDRVGGDGFLPHGLAGGPHDGLPVVTKAGAFGEDDIFVKALAILKAKGNCI